MLPKRFNEANYYLKMQDNQGGDVEVPVFYDSNIGAFVTCWELSAHEIQDVLTNGVIYLTLVTGDTKHPITELKTKKPVKEKPKDGEE